MQKEGLCQLDRAVCLLERTTSACRKDPLVSLSRGLPCQYKVFSGPWRVLFLWPSFPGPGKAERGPLSAKKALLRPIQRPLKPTHEPLGPKNSYRKRALSIHPRRLNFSKQTDTVRLNFSFDSTQPQKVLIRLNS